VCSERCSWYQILPRRELSRSKPALDKALFPRALWLRLIAIVPFLEQPRSNGRLHVQVATWLKNLDAVVLAEPVQQHEALPQHAIPGVTLGVMQALALVLRPLGEQDCSRIFATENNT
jgi:hypothetical protein